jgi:hypothetical protein
MKLSICVPCRDQVHTLFTQSLVNLTNRLTRKQIEFELHLFAGSVICESRTRLVEEALSVNSDKILFLDSDIQFPSNMIDKLYSHNKDIVAANYSTRYPIYQSVAFTDPENITARLDATQGLHKIWAVGMGCMLIDIDVFHTLPKPWFVHEYNKIDDTFSGEDIYFCNQAMHHGIDVWVDSDIKLGHIGTKAYTL